MKIKTLHIVLISFCLLVAAGANCLAQDEATYKQSLSRAAAQKNPSEYRAQALKKYIAAGDTLTNSEGYPMSERQLNQFVADKLKELMVIDFYAASLAQLPPNPDFIKWREVLELMPTEQVAAFKKLDQWRASGSKTYPADLPSPGTGWVKTVSNSVQAENPTVAATNQPQPSTVNNSSDSAYIEFIWNLAAVQLEQGKFNESIKSASDCLKINNKIHNCYQVRSLAYFAIENYDAAIGDFTQYIQLQPKDPQGFTLRAECYVKKKNYDAAIADLNTALELRYDRKLAARRDEVKRMKDAANNH